ncbi:MAG: hypothetical protein ACP5HU_12305 [Phycisphaerae bacterium]
MTPHIDVAAPWHRESYHEFVARRLPELLAQRLPLSGYRTEPAGDGKLKVTVAVGDGPAARTDYMLPAPDADGLFQVEGRRVLVLPVADSEDLEAASIRCVGEQIADLVASRLGKANGDVPWSEDVLRAWLPLERWVREMLSDVAAAPWDPTGPTVQALDNRNWLARTEHLRRIAIPSRQDVIHPSHFGRLCPLSTPEGPNVGRILTVARGAAIRDGKLAAADGGPGDMLGPTASMVPLLEHDDPNRLLMGANMMRQWLVPPDPEPALVQTGNEPDEADFWCGRNLLTAYISWGGDTFEDGIVVSESAARRLGYPRPLEPGDKLSNRHGAKGVVSGIVADEEMPHLPDGTAVDLVYSFIALHTRLNFGQVREALLGRIAKAEGRPVVAPPFEAPRADDLRRRLREAGLREDGMEMLTSGQDGKPLTRPGVVGYVYWGKTHHLSADKLRSWQTDGGQPVGELEFYALRECGAIENLLEMFNTRSLDRPGVEELSQRLAAGDVERADTPTPTFAALQARLRAAGIEAAFDGQSVAFRLAEPQEDMLKLSEPVNHPWLPGRTLEQLGLRNDVPGASEVAVANDRLLHMLDGDAPAALLDEARKALAMAVRRYLDALVTPEHLRPAARVAFSGRGVITPGPELAYDQVGLPEEMLWTLLGPRLAREIGTMAVHCRTREATAAMDELAARSWVLIHRSPSVIPTSVVAFRPVRVAGPALRLPPLACLPMNADFDGDQVGVYIPLTYAAQAEAGEKLSLLGHLRRDADLLHWILPAHEVVWGLAELGRTPEGLREVCELAGAQVAAPNGIITRGTLEAALREVLHRNGAEAALERSEQLARRGFEATKASGASLSPFAGASLQRPPEPQTSDASEWSAHAEQLRQQLAARSDFDNPDLGPQLLAVRSGARGAMRQVEVLLGVWRMVTDAAGRRVGLGHGLVQGRTAQDLINCVPGARRGLAGVADDCLRQIYGLREVEKPAGFSVLARAMRAERPGVVFAAAAAAGETDPLTEPVCRLFVGFPAV